MIIKTQIKEMTMKATELKKTINNMSVRNPQFYTGSDGKNDKVDHNEYVSDQEYGDDFSEMDSHE